MGDTHLTSRGGKPVVGVVSCPAVRCRWWAAQGVGAFRDSRRVRVSSARRLAETVLLEDFRISVGRQLASNPMTALARICAGVHPFRDRFDVLLVGDGSVDVVLLWFAGTGPDLYSWVCILTEAGGRHSDLRGSSDVDAQVQLATNGFVHDEALAFVNGLVACGAFDPTTEPIEDLAAIKHARTLQSERDSQFRS